jgi:predicted transcriptional regulator
MIELSLTLFAVSAYLRTLKTPTVKCEHCNGTGKIPDSKKIGWQLREARKFARIGLREMAAEIGVSYGHLHDLEHGRRNWTPRLLTDYNAALDRAS